jgi:hypothetical protein
MILKPCFLLQTSQILSGMIESYMKKCKIPKISIRISLPTIKIPTALNDIGVRVNVLTGCIPTPWDGILAEKRNSILSRFRTAPSVSENDLLEEVITSDTIESEISLSSGLKEVETDLALFTHSNLNDVMSDYAEAEADIAETLESIIVTGDCLSEGVTLSGLLDGTISLDYLIQTPPTITFSELTPYEPSSSSSSGSSDIVSNTPYLLVTELLGGNMNLTNFAYEWTIISTPESGDVSYEELYNEQLIIQWNIGNILSFNIPGSYVIMMVATSNIYPSLQVTEKLSIEVV